MPPVNPGKWPFLWPGRGARAAFRTRRMAACGRESPRWVVRPDVALNVDARSLSVEQLADVLGGGNFRGGHAELSANLKLHGNSLRKLTASATGNVLLGISDTRLEGGAVVLERNLMFLTHHLILRMKVAVMQMPAIGVFGVMQLRQMG